MAFHGAPYVATATPAHLEDFARKLIKARAVKDGLAYIHLLSPCPTGWRARADSTLDICRAAVDTNYFPLWEADEGRFRITQPVAKPKPISEFTRLMGRYSHLKAELMEEMQTVVNQRYQTIADLCRLWPQEG